MGADDRTPPPGQDALDASPFVHSFAADDVALAAMSRRATEDAPRCHVCDEAIHGEPAASGLLVWSRGETLRTEEPPLCRGCAAAIGVSALRRFALEDDEEG